MIAQHCLRRLQAELLPSNDTAIEQVRDPIVPCQSRSPFFVDHLANAHSGWVAEMVRVSNHSVLREEFVYGFWSRFHIHNGCFSCTSLLSQKVVRRAGSLPFRDNSHRTCKCLGPEDLPTLNVEWLL